MNRTHRNIKADYLSGAEPLQPFYQYSPLSPDFEQIIQDKVFPEHNRKVLVESLNRQYEGIALADKVRENLDKLALPNTYTLTAGHQLNLFGGPLFTVYKLVTILKLARQLAEKHPDHHFVPVFWIHTEDHDYQEINHYFSTYTSKHTYPGKFTGAVGHHVLGDRIQEQYPPHFATALKESYQPGISMAQAYRRFIHELFGAHGLVILDADQPELKALFEDAMKEEVLSQAAFRTVTSTSEQLEAAGYSLQITPRPINLFYLNEEGRNRIVEENGQYAVLQTPHTFSQEEMLVEISTHPERFSPNVSLRPLYQETILPNLMYTGGWGELSYWMQLKGVFGHHGINFPLLLPRMSTTIFLPEQLKAWQNLGFSPSDIQKPLNQLFLQYMPQIWQDDTFNELTSQLLTDFDALSSYIEGFSATLPRSVVGQRVKTEKFFKNLRKKLHRVIRHNEPAVFNQIEQLKLALQPDGQVQERRLSLASFPGMEPKELIQQAYDACQPLVFEHMYLDLAGIPEIKG